MRIRLPLTVAIASTLLIGTTGTAQAAPSLQGTVVSDTMFGLHVKNVQQGVWPDVQFGSLRLWDNDTSWSGIEKSPGVFDWTALDTAIATANANGVTDIMMVLSGTPQWASTSSCTPPACLPTPGAAGMPRNLADWDNWVTQVVTRYKGKITSYQPWNEANLQTFFEGTPEQMADITARTYRIVKSIDPAALVIAPSTGTRLGGPFKKFYPRFLNALKAEGWPVDVWAVHTYPASKGTPVDRAALARTYQAVLNAAGAPNKPIWDTENNYGLKGPGPQNPDVDIEGIKAANWVSVTYLDSLRLNIERVYMYTWEPPNDLWGIQFHIGTQGAKGFTTTQKWLVGSTFKGCTQKGARVTCTITSASGETQQIVYPTKGRKMFKVPAQYKQACNVLDVCAPISKGKVRTAGPMLLTR